MPSTSLTKLNALESAIIYGEDSVEDARWSQAQEVARLIESGMTQRQIAAGWINGRTDKPYDHAHVKHCASVWRRFGEFTHQDRPDWTTAYYTVQQGSDEVVDPEQRKREWSEAHEVRAPTTPEAAEKFVQNVIKAPANVQDKIYEGLRAHRYDQPLPGTRERKERDAAADETVRPMVEVVDRSLGKLELVAVLEEAAALLHEMVERQSLDTASMTAIRKAADDLFAELEVAEAMFGVNA